MYIFKIKTLFFSDTRDGVSLPPGVTLEDLENVN